MPKILIVIFVLVFCFMLSYTAIGEEQERSFSLEKEERLWVSYPFLKNY